MSTFSTPTPAMTQETLPSGAWRSWSYQRKPPELPKGLDALWQRGAGVSKRVRNHQKRLLDRAAIILKKSEKYRPYKDETLRVEGNRLREVFRRQRDTPSDLDDAFALIREAAGRTLGMWHHRVQVAAGLGIAEGMICELATGEGKTLVATLPAVVAGWRGHGCHVITVNDYLAKRDAELMMPVYAFFRLSVGIIQEDSKPDERRAAYASDLTYLTNKEVAGDFLRDRLAIMGKRRLASMLLDKTTDEAGRCCMDGTVMRGLDTCIVDEADSVMIDEAVTPLIISGAPVPAQDAELFNQAAQVVAMLSADKHFEVVLADQEVTLTPEGQARVDELCVPLGGAWLSQRRRDELIDTALRAAHLFENGKQYIIDDGKAVIVDESTGRLQPDRSWRDGVHQAVEAKEGLEINPPKGTLARVSYQKFFRLYRVVGGMTGTAAEASPEFYLVYGLPTVKVPTNKPCLRIEHPDRVYGTSDARWSAVVEEARAAQQRGQPVLIGTRSIGASEHLSEKLTEAGLTHKVLNAVHHEQEAAIVSEAGQPGAITVATNMAGRGTDIKLTAETRAAGGLFVIVTERHESRRVDRQLIGRCARQGDPGAAVTLVSLEDELIRKHGSLPLKQIVKRAAAGNGEGLSTRSSRLLYERAQHKAQKRALKQRRSVLRHDEWLEDYLGFAGVEG